MKLRDIKDISKDDVLGVLGLETKPSTTSHVAALLGIFGAGLLVGAGIALLVAPKPGRELREDIRARLRPNGKIEELEVGV
jgi:hypothetical protein